MNSSWPWRPLGELFEIGAGKTMSAAARNGQNKTPFLRTSNVLWDEIDLSFVDQMSIPKHELTGRLLRPGDLLVCEGGEIGRAAIWNGEIETMSYQNHLHRLRPIDDGVEPRFYVYFLQCAFTQIGIFAGAGNSTTIPNLSRGRLAGLRVPQPTIDEQRSIVTALSRTRNAVAKQDSILMVTRDLKRIATNELFAHGIKRERQQNTEVGPLPGSWQRLPIAKLGKVVTGNTPSSEEPENYIDGSIPFVTPGDIEHGCLIDKTKRFIAHRSAKRSRCIMAGTTCFVCIGSTIGKVGYSPFPISTTNQQINSIVPYDGYDPLFVFYLMLFWSDYIGKQASLSPVPILSKSVFERVEIVTTQDIEEQRKIASVIASIDKKISFHRRRKALYYEVYRTLLRDLMTGNVHALKSPKQNS